MQLRYTVTGNTLYIEASLSTSSTALFFFSRRLFITPEYYGTFMETALLLNRRTRDKEIRYDSSTGYNCVPHKGSFQLDCELDDTLDDTLDDVLYDKSYCELVG